MFDPEPVYVPSLYFACATAAVDDFEVDEDDPDVDDWLLVCVVELFCEPLEVLWPPVEAVDDLVEVAEDDAAPDDFWPLVPLWAVEVVPVDVLLAVEAVELEEAEEVWLVAVWVVEADPPADVPDVVWLAVADVELAELVGDDAEPEDA